MKRICQKPLRTNSKKGFFRAGDLHPNNELYVFRNYESDGREIWQTKDARKKVLERKKAYRQKTEVKARHSKYNATRAKQKSKEDPSFKLKLNLRTRLNHAIKGNSKSAKTLELLGCSIEDLKKHLESLFQDGMSWENYGINGWHIDHIKPCIAFDLSKEAAQKQCFHYSNLQPLWAIENLKKGGSH
jgi:hypothetical protein